MRKVFNKVLAGITSATLVASLLIGVNVTNQIKADDTSVTLSNWAFSQGGQYNPKEPANVAYLNSVTMDGTNEKIGGWLRGADSVKQEQKATQLSTGFHLDVEDTGWDKDWGNDTINPWSIMATMDDVTIEPGHVYTVSFKAHASKKKFGYVKFGSNVGDDLAPYDKDLIKYGDDATNQVISIGVNEKTFTFTFTNWVSATKLSTTLMFGAFNSKKDYAGNDVSNIIDNEETGWKGDIYVSDFTITDKGQNSEFETDAPIPTEKPTQKPTEKPTSSVVKPGKTEKPTTKPAVNVNKTLAKVKGLKAVNKKKGTVKLSWKKVSKAKKYQIKVGSKTYSAKKNTLTVKKLKKGKKYTFKVRAIASGYKSSAWVKKSIKIKK